MNQDVPGTSWQASDGLHIDTRGLGPPDPLVAVLWHIGQPGQNGPVTVYFDRNPINLFIELAERGWTFEYLAQDPDDVRLLLKVRP